MNDKSFLFWLGWLKSVSVFVIVFGLFMSASSVMPKSEPSAIDKQINASFFFNENAVTAEVMRFQSWQYGVGASMLVSWGVMILLLSIWPLSQKEYWAWKTAIIALLSWFIIDQTVSLFYGVSFNVVFNSVLFLLLISPLLMMRKTFNAERDL